METVIEIRNIAKRYHLGEGARMYGSFREVLSRPLRRSAPKNADGVRKPADSFWALKDVSLDVQKGDTIGVIGSNGAGKSTLLKIISRITDPSSGHIKVRGRIGSLLEVGTGFHPELTGRENIYLNGAILGMRKTEIDANFDAITGFAGIGAFLDTPVKRYSSGMYVRLAFSIAAHLDPEILIVDEVLAVGDVAFQKKCLGKMAEACSRARTVLFVSHNLAAVENICNRGIVLHRGEVAFDGKSKDAINFYLHDLEDNSAVRQSHIVDLSNSPNRVPKYHPHLKRLELFDENDRPLRGDVPTGSRLKAVVYFNLETPCKTFDASVAFDTLGGQRICTAHSAYEPDRIHEERTGEQVFVCEIPSLPLVPGEYKIHVGLDISSDEVDWVEDATRLTVTRSDFYGTGVVPTKGVFLMPNRWELEPAREEVAI
jgi:lipopolysaccharide transport system ATP-binding protein